MFKKKEDKVEEEILSIVEEGHEQGFIHENEAEMISNILDFDDKKVRDIMTSRNKIFAVEKSARIGECLENCLQSGFSRYPVYENDIDNIIGVLHLKDMVEAFLRSSAISVSTIIDEPMFVHPTYDISKLLKKMQKEKKHMAIVLDEYGQTDGIVTFEDRGSRPFIPVIDFVMSPLPVDPHMVVSLHRVDGIHKSGSRLDRLKAVLFQVTVRIVHHLPAGHRPSVLQTLIKQHLA